MAHPGTPRACWRCAPWAPWRQLPAAPLGVEAALVQASGRSAEVFGCLACLLVAWLQGPFLGSFPEIPACPSHCPWCLVVHLRLSHLGLLNLVFMCLLVDLRRVVQAIIGLEAVAVKLAERLLGMQEQACMRTL